MSELKSSLPSKIFEVIERAGISTSKQIIILSVWDIKKLTNLCTDDIILLKNKVADHLSPQPVTCEKLSDEDCIQNSKTTSGCIAIDKLLHGGFRRGTLIEIYGESGSGKTQIALQAAAHNWRDGCVYICTEDLFPIKRFEQIKHRQINSGQNYSADTDYGKNIFVEHVTEAHDLLSCVRVRLPKLIDKHKCSIVIIDSVAAPFRTEYTNYVQRAEDLRELAISLLCIAQKYNLAVVCINQVTANFNANYVLPSLGLAWSNMISTRLWLQKTTETIDLRHITGGEIYGDYVNIREMSVIFTPDLPNNKAKLYITPFGIQGVE